MTVWGETVPRTEPNSVFWNDALNFLHHSGWCPSRELAAVVLTRTHEGRLVGAEDFLRHDCDNLNESTASLKEVLSVAAWYLGGQRGFPKYLGPNDGLE